MGTSNWQNIPFCVEVLMKIQPQNVLDVGIGFGRWGILLREFCEVWSGRIFPQDWLINIEGIEAYENNVAQYHSHFYNRIHVGDAIEIIPTLSGIWDIVVFGDVLEHFKRKDAEYLLDWATVNSKYVMLNIPLGNVWPQEEMYGNSYEQHQSSWMPDDFIRFHLVISRIFLDFKGRPFGVFIFSQEDPASLISNFPNDQGDSLSEQETRNFLQESILSSELNAIKNSVSYKLANRIEKSIFSRTLRHIFRKGIIFSGKIKSLIRGLFGAA